MPHGLSATVVALPGPPTPPATVLMVPGAGAARLPGAACARPGPAASAASASAAAAPVSRMRAGVLCLLVSAGFIQLSLSAPRLSRSPSAVPPHPAGALVGRGSGGLGLLGQAGSPGQPEIIRTLLLSAIRRPLRAATTAVGKPRSAWLAGPPSPVKPVTPVPA